MEGARHGTRAGELPLAPLRLYLLGGFEVIRADVPIPAHAWRRRRPADLLKLVALSQGRTLPRQRVIDTLWPDKDPASGANNLHRALYDLRQILGGRWVEVERGELTLQGNVWLDVDAFEEAVRRGGREGWTHAVALYRGDLAPQDRDAPWLEARREALRARFVEAAAPLARAAASEGDVQLAVPLLRRLVEADPSAEEPHRLLLRVLAESGRRADALRQYDASELTLRAAGVAPSGDLRALRAAIDAGELGPPPGRPTLDAARRAARRLLGTAELAPVRGRGPLLLVLESLLEQGSGAIVLLGERGVGKTRLALEGARLAQSRGAAVLCGTGGTLPGAAYSLFADAFREAARVNPALVDPFASGAPAGLGGEEVRRALFHEVESAIRAFADGRALFLVLDDLHAADESSLNLLHFLARRARDLRLIVVATACEEAVHAGTPIQMALAHLDCGRLARGVRVPRLSLSGTREQIADLDGGGIDARTVAQIHRITDGTPLLVEEVVRARRELGSALPLSPTTAIRGRVARLGARAEALLAAAAVAGTRFECEPVRRVSAIGAHEAVAVLRAAMDAQLVHEDGSAYRFHHAIVRDTIYTGIEPDRRAALHAALADALESLAGAHEPPSEAIAFHRRHAGQEQQAVRHLVAAGHRAAARAGHREALAFYSEALELSTRHPGGDAAARLELLDAIGRVRLALGHVSGAARAFGEAARLRDGTGALPVPALRARSHRLAAVALASAGRVADAHGEIAEGLAAAREAGEDESAALLRLEAQLLLHEGRWAEEAAVADKAAGVLAPARDAELSDGAPDHLFDVDLVLWDRDLLADGGVTEMTRLAGILGERARARGAPPGATAVAQSGEGAAALAAGHAELAERILRDALHGHRASASALGEAHALERLATALTVQGRLEEARDALDEAVVVAERGVLRQHALTRVHTAEARNRLAAGALYSAEDSIREASESAARHGACLSCDATFRPEAVRVLLLRGRIAEAEIEVDHLEEMARQRGGRVLEAIARLARARTLAARGHDQVALLALAEALAAFVAAGHRYEAARCARLHVRLAGPGAAVPDEVRALDPLVIVDADA